jgi:Cys-tRNA(Pro)/Cys-tRNA(Cys) deacylase
MPENKTNAMRALERAHIPFLAHSYAHEDGFIDGVSIARKLGQPLCQVFKTLVTAGSRGGYFVFVIPVAEELDLKAAAQSVGEKSVAMIPVKSINAVTGYIRGGCSPIGMKKSFPTVVDTSALEQEKIFVSAGRIGQQIELVPEDLLRFLGAKTAPLTLAAH